MNKEDLEAVEFWKDCIDETYKDMDMTPLVTMIVKRVID